MVMLMKRAVLYAKEESTYGTDPTPTKALNSIKVRNLSIKEHFDEQERDVQLSTLSREASKAGMKWVEVTFQVEIFGSGTAGTAPRSGDLLEACGFSETIVASTSVTYLPASTGLKSATIYGYRDGRLWIVTGCVGNVKITAPAGSFGLFEFTMHGLYTAPTDTAIEASIVYESTDPVVVETGSFDLNSVTTLVTQQLEIDMQNAIASRPSISGTHAIAGHVITGRNPIANINPEAVTVATYDFRGDWGATARALSTVIGASAGNICTLSIPKFMITDVTEADQDGRYVEQIQGQCALNAGDDEVSIAFT